MDSLGSNTSVDVTGKLATVVIFLLLLWFALNWFSNKIKAGGIKIPAFLKRGLPGLEGLIQGPKSDLYQIEIIQRKILPDTSELMVLDINGRHLLLSRHPQSGISYLCDLDNGMKH